MYVMNVWVYSKWFNLFMKKNPQLVRSVSQVV